MNGVVPYQQYYMVMYFGHRILFFDKIHADKCYQQLKTGLISPNMFLCEPDINSENADA